MMPGNIFAGVWLHAYVHDFDAPIVLSFFIYLLDVGYIEESFLSLTH